MLAFGFDADGLHYILGRFSLWREQLLAEPEVPTQSYRLVQIRDFGET
jgi:hypothetical protein